VYVGTSEGIFRRPLSTAGAWEPAGITQLDVRALRVANAPVPTLYAVGYPANAAWNPVYRTTDGTTWTPGGDGLRSTLTGRYLGIASLAIQPGAGATAVPTLYTTATGTNIARSLDQGATWSMVSGRAEESSTYDCMLHVSGNLLFQGCEAPLDVAWVRRFDVAQRDRASLGEGTVVVDRIDNRRINGFFEFSQIPSTSPTVFVGVEGGLLSLDVAGTWKWIHQFTSGTGEAYPYVRAVWVDPSAPRHIIFGGGESRYSSARSGLFESEDGGKTVVPRRGPFDVDLSRAGIPAATTAGADGRDLLLVVDLGYVRRVLLRVGGA
jgi:hypothetical protein